MRSYQTSIDAGEKIELAIRRMRLACDMSERYYNQPLLVTYSGGKDSDALIELALLSGGSFEVQHSITSVDMPETMRHIKDTFRRLRDKGIICSYFHKVKDGRVITMWNLIPPMLMPPTRLVRYCCKALKETGGSRRAIATGVRRDESVKRSNRTYANNFSKARPAAIDFEDAASLFEDATSFQEHDDNFLRSCRLKGRTSFQPIIDWSDDDVFAFLDTQGVETNPLYDEGFRRVGCIGCPNATTKMRMEQLGRYPQYERAYRRAFGKMLKERERRGLETQWTTVDEVFDWWLGLHGNNNDKTDRLNGN